MAGATWLATRSLQPAQAGSGTLLEAVLVTKPAATALPAAADVTCGGTE